MTEENEDLIAFLVEQKRRMRQDIQEVLKRCEEKADELQKAQSEDYTIDLGGRVEDIAKNKVRGQWIEYQGRQWRIK